ncbi:asparaginase [Agrilactobacillus composti DSM 18527 = JCM 14202]|uniref:Asparaginase n=1 Tax=Agrilactobacillus composti DSM 18527 = JCM 14202 TaxID=1423734 RepID=A0A0R1XQG3_9LACO|nr:asparaginase [Agrilactobacillus composti]KRM32503.1 asparaginase [Agrilactobacillus composti DSM 18527 = JCM 14202]
MKKILALHTGGTISMSQNTAGEVSLNKSNPLLDDNYDQLFDHQINLTSEEIFNLPSPHMSMQRMLQLHDRILQAEAAGIDGVVVTHGTDTLEETAYFLDLTLPDTIPVVVTGAMRSSNEIGSDGLYNFMSAVWTAASPQSRGKGVLVVMNDEVHTARYVTKTHTTNVSTFRTPTFGPIGLVAQHKVQFFQELITQENVALDHVVDRVYLVKAYAGMDAQLLEAIANPNTNGLVLEALGAGNMPPQTLPALRQILDLGIPVVLVSRCFNGVAQAVYEYEGGGVQLEKMGIIYCRGLNGPKARIKLLVGLSAGKSPAEIRHYLSDAVS